MDWFETWFDTPYYHILYKNHDCSEAENFIGKLSAVLSLPQGSKIIDLACGRGRHSVFLNQLGYDVLGLDLSQKSIAHNQQFTNASLQFRVHDMRTPIHGERVDAVLNLFTSFGYFENDEDDRKVFRAVHGILKPGRFFVLDYLNHKFVRNNLEEKSHIEREGIVFNIRKSIQNNYIVKKIDFTDAGKAYSFFERVKLHTPESIVAYAEDAGFERLKVWGDYSLSDFQEETSPRCINLFRKK